MPKITKRIVTLNVAGRKDIGSRIDKITHFLDTENADIVCLQEITFNNTESLAYKINSKLQNPYDFVQADLAETYVRNGERQTDGLAILSRNRFNKAKTITLTKVPDDENGRPDFHKRIAQLVVIEDGTKIVNTHLASNNNSHLQFKELLETIPDEYIITGDFNLPKPKMLNSKNFWGEKYTCSIELKDYLSFPKENQTFDYFLVPKTIKLTDIRIIKGLSDHNAIACEINKMQ